MKITKPLTRVIAVGLGISLLFASTNISAAAQNTWLKQNTKEIKSLTSEDYSDLAFLKPLLKDKTVVSLGENFHRVAEYSDVKTRLIKYLHEELDFDVIAFESGLGDSAVIYDNADSLTAQQMMGGSIFPIWHSKETLKLFDYIKQQRKTNKPLYLAGYDMQFTSGYLTQFIAAWISKLDKDYGKQYFDFEMQGITELYAVMNKYGTFSNRSPQYKAEIKKVIDKYEPQYKNLIQFIKDNRVQLAAAYPNNPHIVDIAIKSLSDRIKFMEMCLYNEKESYEFRDKIMADNVEWLMKVMYPGKKIILWAHNDHLAKNTSKISTIENGKWMNSFTSMGELLHKRLKGKEYVIGLYMNRGKASTITTQKPFDINPMPKGSLENLMMQSGYKNVFIDLSKHSTPNKNNAWMFKPIYAAEDGMTSEIIRPMSMKFVPKEQYDGIIVIDKVKTPTPIQ
ncbi:erythromycin esterase family protein [Aneurinibacillus aneurinilyticus]|jgi:erythromycin esterase|uniref:Erythromycin esterase family protein n=1 Tax=Aneurinibacillus aneurinilyticus TaxID=1391 RepID=A0A848CY99_ANEAE|nr:erythromycin esterase family protein [Aneurinibacillus aneurinilyticus]MCI1695778.1 erythromycin esterase family protein [Aneurinibacillus aneurinilyticus]MED0673618.1 erythromycin esterase family protein [Aneurinibacillus aneurinilyticus]NME98807.1 erythromycin esterase family protein [Aneurinibacillus aneurinilyticus]